MKKRKSPESIIQKAIIEWANLFIHIYPELQWLHAIPNGGSRNKFEAGRMKGEGVKPGVYDLCLPCARKGYHGFYLEIIFIFHKLLILVEDNETLHN